MGEDKSIIRILFIEKRLPWKVKTTIKKLKKSLQKQVWKLKNNYILGQFQKKQHLKLASSARFKKTETEKPNIILIVMDTARAQDLPMYGGKAFMPFVSRFSENSTVCKNAYTCANWTIPSHASLFTGLYPHNHNTTKGTDKLDTSIPTLAEILKKNNYNTFCLTDNYLICKENNLAKGFQNYLHTHHEFGGAEKKLKKFIPKLKEKPFFLFINLLTPHLPYMINPAFFRGLSKKEIKELTSINLENEDYLKRFSAKTEKQELAKIRAKYHKGYLSALTYLDYQLAKIYSQLQKNDLTKDSIIIITSDHGEEILDHKVKLKDEEYYILEHYTSYNTTIRIPLIIQDIKQEKKIIQRPVNNIDLFPTLLEKLSISYKTDGISLSEKRTRILSENPILNCTALIKDKKKMIKWPHKTELFNIEKDPYEIFPLKEEKTGQELLKEIEKLEKKQNKEQEKMNSSQEEKMKQRLKALGYI